MVGRPWFRHDSNKTNPANSYAVCGDTCWPTSSSDTAEERRIHKIIYYFLINQGLLPDQRDTYVFFIF